MILTFLDIVTPFLMTMTKMKTLAMKHVHLSLMIVSPHTNTLSEVLSHTCDHHPSFPPDYSSHIIENIRKRTHFVTDRSRLQVLIQRLQVQQNGCKSRTYLPYSPIQVLFEQSIHHFSDLCLNLAIMCMFRPPKSHYFSNSVCTQLDTYYLYGFVMNISPNIK